MRRSLAALLLSCALAACEKSPAPATKAATAAPKPVVPPDEPDVDSDNLLNLGYGAAVVSRSGELNLDSSVVHAIDGLRLSTWVSAPGASEELAVFSLLAPARILRVGMTGLEEEKLPDSVRFEGSTDGKKWRDLATLKPEKTTARQLTGVPETPVVRFIRVRAITAGRYYLAASAFHVLGEEVAPPDAPPFTGCWMVNGMPVHLRQEGARITGVIETDPPVYLDGGTDNRAAWVMWLQGNGWGYAVLTRSNDGAFLSGVRFYEEMSRWHLGEAWLGGKCAAGRSEPARDPRAVPAAMLAASGRYSVFGIVYDPTGRIVPELSASALESIASLMAAAPARRFRLTAHEFLQATPELNARLTAARLDALRAALKARGIDPSRLDLVAAGSRWEDPAINSTIQRQLATRIDIETVGR